MPLDRINAKDTSGRRYGARKLRNMYCYERWVSAAGVRVWKVGVTVDLNQKLWCWTCHCSSAAITLLNGYSTSVDVRRWCIVHSGACTSFSNMTGLGNGCWCMPGGFLAHAGHVGWGGWDERNSWLQARCAVPSSTSLCMYVVVGQGT